MIANDASHGRNHPLGKAKHVFKSYHFHVLIFGYLLQKLLFGKQIFDPKILLERSYYVRLCQVSGFTEQLLTQILIVIF